MSLRGHWGHELYTTSLLTQAFIFPSSLVTSKTENTPKRIKKRQCSVRNVSFNNIRLCSYDRKRTFGGLDCQAPPHLFRLPSLLPQPQIMVAKPQSWTDMFFEPVKKMWCNLRKICPFIFASFEAWSRSSESGPHIGAYMKRASRALASSWSDGFFRVLIVWILSWIH